MLMEMLMLPVPQANDQGAADTAMEAFCPRITVFLSRRRPQREHNCLVLVLFGPALPASLVFHALLFGTSSCLAAGYSYRDSHVARDLNLRLKVVG